MDILHNVSLKPYNTFGMDVPAEYFTVLNEVAQIQELEEKNDLPSQKTILGGGSNILLTKPVAGLVIKNELKGIDVAEENEDHIWLEVKAGEIWHHLVLYTIHRGWGGLENLSLIPGCVGASPMQNIGAYGVEVKDTIDQVVAWHWQEKRFIVFYNSDCRFGYRDSIFKNKLKDKVLITSVTFRLHKQPQLNTSYGAIQQELQAMGVSEPSVRSVSDAVIAIRSSKLPDPEKIGNSGSFFKNPTISVQQFQKLQTIYPSLPSYKVSDDQIKLAAGWLIEQCGWKGYRKGDAGVHEKQALVLVNYGHAKGSDVYQLSSEIIQSVKEKFDIALEREVQLL
ncbi:MAG TPA: UDP-N-acetylmuramate dehydrogenase [Flavipsychrobacter sp.]|nr:UDP-N-acetylmuramate dehydrogenase [Flavipsychrobacter sp.]